MIEQRIKTLSDYLSKKSDVTWREKEAFNQIIEHCLITQNHYNNKTRYVERLMSWYIDHMIELNQDEIDEVSMEFIQFILTKLKWILESPAESNYMSIENNVIALDIKNNRNIRPYGQISESIELYVRDIINYNTIDKHGTL